MVLSILESPMGTENNTKNPTNTTRNMTADNHFGRGLRCAFALAAFTSVSIAVPSDSQVKI